VVEKWKDSIVVSLNKVETGEYVEKIDMIEDE